MEKKGGLGNPNELCVVLIRNDVYRSGQSPEALRALGSLDGIKIIHSKVMDPTRELFEKHYNKDEAWLSKVGAKIIELLCANHQPANLGALAYGRQVLQSLIDYNTEGPMIAVLLRGFDACDRLRQLVGHTNPAEAAIGTLRFKYSDDSFEKAGLEIRVVRNGFHCSENDFDGLVEAERFFPEFNLLGLIKG